MEKRQRVKYTIKRAGLQHVDALMELSAMFQKESNFNGYNDFAPHKARRTIVTLIADHEDACPLIAINPAGQVVGYALVVKSDAYTVHPIGDIYIWYIEPSARGTGCARDLRDAVIAQFDAWGCAMRYVECSAGLDAGKNDKQFFNLWAKMGYEFLGTAMVHRQKIT